MSRFSCFHLHCLSVPLSQVRNSGVLPECSRSLLTSPLQAVLCQSIEWPRPLTCSPVPGAWRTLTAPGWIHFGGSRKALCGLAGPLHRTVALLLSPHRLRAAATLPFLPLLDSITSFQSRCRSCHLVSLGWGYPFCSVC